ncbi:unnamed protein product [Medioppia subpectinata]|uniref:Arrestin-like N-terminal domain-containing protein n=1 Tax=Medioppia subpectinata TaxID=1979941 RepID=A0A7R9KM97_9ACAR|nr:unnamed protein product [Medioppia subpectinata]CAG2104889.1 unnamed protein product [Medioppia subpectinata]
MESYAHSNERVLTSGDKVTGKCIIEIDGVLKLSQIVINIIGFEYARIEQGRSTYYGHDRFLKVDFNFVGQALDREIGKGLHELPFVLPLPNEGIPSSFKARNAAVEYSINGMLRKPQIFKRNHRVDKIPFIVEAPFILPELMLPRQMVSEKQIGLLANDGSVRGTVSVPMDIPLSMEATHISITYELRFTVKIPVQLLLGELLLDEHLLIMNETHPMLRYLNNWPKL